MSQISDVPQRGANRLDSRLDTSNVDSTLGITALQEILPRCRLIGQHSDHVDHGGFVRQHP
jgi:hypothetical protein